jgi:hypothetical protein
VRRQQSKTYRFGDNTSIRMVFVGFVTPKTLNGRRNFASSLRFLAFEIQLEPQQICHAAMPPFEQIRH